MLALYAVISYISGTLSKCEFKTYFKDDEVKDDEYYLWNVSPNVNESSGQFINHWLTRLIMDNEALIIEDRANEPNSEPQLLVADAFSLKREFALYPNVYNGITVSGFLFEREYTASDVLYFKWSNSSIDQVLGAYYESYKNLISKVGKSIERSRGEQGILNVSTQFAGGEEAKTKITDLMNSRFKAYFEGSDVVVPLEDGLTYQKTDQGSSRKLTEVSDIRKLIDDVLDMTAIAFKVPPALLKGQATEKDGLVKNYLTFCIDPLAEMLSDEINRKRYGKKQFLEGTRLNIDTSNAQHVELFDVATSIDKLISSGSFSPDEIRKE